MEKLSTKNVEKWLTKKRESDNIYKLSREKRRATKKVDAKKLEKSFKKVLTRGYIYDILFELSSREAGDWTLKIKQRDKKRNPRFDGKKPSRRVFKSTFQTVIRKLK